jgi:hypothetical protein
MKKTYLKPRIEVVVLEDKEVASMAAVCKTGNPTLTMTSADRCNGDELTELDACIDEQFLQPCRAPGS